MCAKGSSNAGKKDRDDNGAAVIQPSNGEGLATAVEVEKEIA